MLPTLAIIKMEKTTDYVVGLDELGGTEDFSTGALQKAASGCGVVGSLTSPETDDGLLCLALRPTHPTPLSLLQRSWRHGWRR